MHPGEGTRLQDRYAGAVMNTFGPPRRVLVRGVGCYVWDDAGNRYLDMLGGIAVNALGHAHPAVIDAVHAQMSTLGHVSNFFASEPQVALAERLLTLLGAGDGRVFFTSSGTEANETAFKIARRTGRRRIVAANGGFHGRTMGSLALTAKASYREPFEPLPGGVVFVDYGDVPALAAAVDDDTAAIVLEPIQGEAGVVPAPLGYLAEARRIADAHGALLWLDEVQTGAGRTGRWFAHHSSAVRPDIVTLAKGLGGGFPIGACIGIGPAGSLLAPGQHGSTFGGNPPAAAAALAVLDTIDRDGLLANARLVGGYLTERIRGLRHPLVREVRGEGLLIAVQLHHPIAREVALAALEEGLIINDCTPDVLRLAPPLNVRQEQVDELVAMLPGVLDLVTAAGSTDRTLSASGRNS
jgi:acetylornithine/N-succinyldiaminopimelate aminotransferase